MSSLSSLKKLYLLRGVHPDFALGRRAGIRYALVSGTACFTRLNLKGLEPIQYMEFARNDLSSGDIRGAINALGNAKRAVHLMLESILRILGLKDAYGKMNFPAQLEIVSQLNAFPTRMIYNLNQKRALMEHQYTAISIDEAADFVDVAEMFLLLAYPYLKHTVISAYVGIEGDSRLYEWGLDLVNSTVNIYELRGGAGHYLIGTSVGKVYYNISWKKGRRLLKTVGIGRANREEWLPYLDLFVYCTKRESITLPQETRGDGLYVSHIHHTTFSTPQRRKHKIFR
jgi:hypothetical protein